MTPKEKAKEIATEITNHIFESGCTVNKPLVKQLSIFFVNGIIQSWSEDGNQRLDKGIINWWELVKNELLNL